MLTIKDQTSLQKELFYVLFINGVILFLSLIQNWNSADLFLFLFLQSTLQGLVTLSLLLLLNFRKRSFGGMFFHGTFFLLHYFSFLALLVFATFYEFGYLSLQTLAEGLTIFFSGIYFKEVTIPTQFDTFNVLLTWGFFLIVTIIRSYTKYKNFNETGRSFAEIHISPYSKHLIIFFFAFLVSLVLLKPLLVDPDYISYDLEMDIVNKGTLLAFFIALTFVEMAMVTVANKLDLI